MIDRTRLTTSAWAACHCEGPRPFSMNHVDAKSKGSTQNGKIRGSGLQRWTNDVRVPVDHCRPIAEEMAIKYMQLDYKC